MDYELKQTMIKDRLAALAEEAIEEIGDATTKHELASERRNIYTRASRVLDDVITLQQAGVSSSDALMILILIEMRRGKWE